MVLTEWRLHNSGAGVPNKEDALRGQAPDPVVTRNYDHG